MFDFHMHSSFSADCSVPMEDMVKGAIQKGMKTICFTEHIDYEYPDETITFDIDYTAYSNEINKLREQYGKDITITKGIEIGLQPHLLDRYEQLIASNPFEFAILSLHTVERKALHYGELFIGKTTEEAFQAYYDELLHCVKNFNAYSILGHIDLIKRYSTETVKEPFHDVLKEIFSIIIPQGKGIEINTSGVRYGMTSNLPSRDILELYKAAGGEIITLGSDAHKPEDIGFQFKESIHLLQDIGFQYVATYENDQPIFHKIDSLVF